MPKVAKRSTKKPARKVAKPAKAHSAAMQPLIGEYLSKEQAFVGAIVGFQE